MIHIKDLAISYLLENDTIKLKLNRKIILFSFKQSKCLCMLYTCNKYLSNRVTIVFTWFKKLDSEKYIFVGKGKTT